MQGSYTSVAFAGVEEANGGPDLAGLDVHISAGFYKSACGLHPYDDIA
jgi:hypothetical protein